MDTNDKKSEANITSVLITVKKSWTNDRMDIVKTNIQSVNMNIIICVI